MQLQWPATAAHRIDQVIEQYPNSVALKDGYGHILTYSEMNERVVGISTALRDQNSESMKQAVLGVFQMPSADWICSLLAIHRVGAVYLPLDLQNSIPEAARPAVLLVDKETVGQVNQIDRSGLVAVINANLVISCPNLFSS